jgi:hypothetical protein
MHILSTYASAVLASGLLIACGDDPAQQTAQDKAPALVIGGEDTAAMVSSIYQMPTPNELFAIVRALNGKGQKNALSSAPKADRFATLSGRSLNFGVYATDMVYASNFKLTSEVVRYYLACKDLGEQIGLSTAFNADIQRRLEKNLTHGDSLDVLTNDAYYGAYQKLQAEQMGPTLALVLAGGWVESMHLVMVQLPAYDEGSPLLARIAEQKVSLEQLIDMMEPVKDDANVAPTRLGLMGIRDIYDQLNVVRTPNTGKSASGRMVLGDDVSVSITPAKYEELKAAVVAMRNAITKTEDAPANT